MIERSQVETLLHIYGLPSSASASEIRAVLKSAQYPEEEIEAAIKAIVSINDSTMAGARADALQKIYRSDKSLKPVEISALLGVEVTVTDYEHRAHRQMGMTMKQTIAVLALTLLLGILGLIVAMYAHEVGPFHPTVSAFAK